MIRSLHIENYALIDSLDIDMHNGFSVITGETGAGKSIILGAIGLLLGQRADSKSIKTGARRCVIEAVFDVGRYGFDSFFADNELDFDGDECIIRRELTAAGKSRAFINDSPVALTLLRELGEQLIDIHSQHQNLLLNKEDFQLSVLDTLAGNDVKQTVQPLYNEYQDICRRLDEARQAVQKSQDDEEYIRFQAKQLDDASLQSGEQEELEAEAEILSHAEEIKHALYNAFSYLSDDRADTDTIQNIRQSASALTDISNVFQCEELIERLNSCYIEIKDIADELENQAEDVEYDPQRLQQINERLELIYSLQKKHRVDSIDELLAIQEDLEQQLSAIDNGDEYLAELEKAKANALDKLMKAAEAVSTKRKKAAESLKKDMVSRLIPLGMPNVRFEVQFDVRKEPDASGIDKVAFLFSANKNSALQNVAQVASGGEIARVMLSLKAIIAASVKLPTIIFDEIDTGVSGNIAERMAVIMKEMGDSERQVISITHLPQIAAMGSSHYKVYKEDDSDTTTSHIVELTPDQRIEEIAHMLSGATLTEAAINNAKELLHNE